MASVIAAVKASARQFSVSVVFGASCAATSDSIAASAQSATRTPSAPATSEKTRLSARNWRTSIARVAPSDWRTAISFCRAVRRPRNSDATFAHAMSSTKPTAPSSV